MTARKYRHYIVGKFDPLALIGINALFYDLVLSKQF